MRYAAEKAPAGATNQTQGVLNTRGRFGSRTRSTRIPTDTITNASSVPIETRLAASRIGSDFLSWILNPSENHGLGDTVLRRFLQRAIHESGMAPEIGVLSVAAF